MFEDCSSLSSVSVNFTDWNESNYSTSGWLRGVALTGIFTGPGDLEEIMDEDHIPNGWTIGDKNIIDINGEVPLTLIAEEPTAEVTLSGIGSPITSGLMYRTKNSEWTKYNVNTQITLENVDDYVQLKNTGNKLSTSSSSYIRFIFNKQVKATGNVQSMLNYSDSCNDYCYYKLFSNCINLTKAPELPAINLANRCYREMFIGCTSLTEAPELPASTLANYCYQLMFKDCAGLLDAPKLPATELANNCYSYMFQNCTSLTGVSELPAETLLPYCYNGMFFGCTSLTDAPELPASTLINYCYYNMFRYCSSLSSITVNFTDWNESNYSTSGWLGGVALTGIFTGPGDLEEIIDGNHIPNGWTIRNKNIIDINGEVPLTLIAEEENATITLSGRDNIIKSELTGLLYRTKNSEWTKYNINTQITLENVDDYVQFKNTENIFSYATPESHGGYIPHNATFILNKKIKAAGNIQSMLNYSNSCHGHCYYRLFYNCASLTQAPELPVKNISQYCYQEMFDNCTSLTQAPELPATALSARMLFWNVYGLYFINSSS